MLQISNLSKSYGKQVIFDQVSFVVSSGERVGFVGRNGHGKSTLFKMIIDEEHPDDGIISTPSHYRVGHLSQHLEFTESNVLDEGATALPLMPDGWKETYKLEAILFGLGFTAEDLEADPRKLSGGFQVRLNLAKVLVAEPNLLLLDEPTNYLDIVSVRWLTQFLRNWENELIIITHDREFMDNVSTHTMGIHRNKIKKIPGSTEKFYEQIALEEEIHEQTRLNQEKKTKEVEEFINRFRAKASKARAVQSRVKKLEKMEKLEALSDIKSLEFQFNSVPFSGKWPILVEDLSFAYSNDSEPLISDLTVAIGKNDRIGIIGKNGKGKTTLMNLIAGELNPTTGSVARHSNLRLAYFGQTNINRLNMNKTVEQEVLDVHPDHNRGSARKICGLMMFEGDQATKKISVLSGGERSRVLLGKLLVSPANCLLLDEPTNHLDMYSIESLVDAMEAFDGPVVIVTHSEMILNAIANRLIVFDGGEVNLFEGTYQDFLERVGWQGEENSPGKRGGGKRVEKSPKGKETRKERADLVVERSKILKPIEKRIKETEKRIEELEGSVKAHNDLLVAASNANDGEKISKLSWDLHGFKQEIDRLFERLEHLTKELEDKSKELEA